MSDTRFEYVVDVSQLTFSYGPTPVLVNANLRVLQGQLCGLVGHNGSGKSSLLKVIAGLAEPNSGQVRLFNASVSQACKLGRVAYMPQVEEVDWTFPLNVRDVVLTGRYRALGLRFWSRSSDHTIVHEALERVGMSGLAHRQIGELSGGQRKRVFFARALAQQADLLLLDEPFAGIDKVTQSELSQLLGELTTGGLTVLMATHDEVDIAELCSEVAVVDRTVIRHQRSQTSVPEGLDLAEDSALDEVKR